MPFRRVDKRNKAHGGLGRVTGPDPRNQVNFGQGRVRLPQADVRNRTHGADKSREDTRNTSFGGKGRHDNRRIRWVFTHPFCEEDPFCAVPSSRRIDKEADWLYGLLVDECELLIFQLEQGDPASDREEEKYLHWQGYFELSSKKGFAWIREFIWPFWYVTPAKGKPTQAWNYCCKKDTRIRGPWQLGTPTDTEGEGKRIEQYALAIQKGALDLELIQHHASCFVRYPNARNQIRCVFLKVLLWKLFAKKLHFLS